MNGMAEIFIEFVYIIRFLFMKFYIHGAQMAINSRNL